MSHADRPQPRPHQAEDVTLLVGALQDAAQQPRAQYLAACGTGKTYTSLWVAEAVAEQRVIVAQPSLALIDQAARAWSRASGRPLEQLALCSAQDIAAETSDGQSVTIATATDLATLEAFWNAPPSDPAALRILWVCFASVPRLAELYAAGSPPAADLLIVDEAHLLAGAPKAAQALLDHGLVPARRRLFQTATPIEAPTEGLSETEDGAEVAPLDATPLDATPRAASSQDAAPTPVPPPAVSVGMEREDLFGAVAAERTFGWAIDAGILTPYRVSTPAPVPPAAAARLDQLPVPPGRDADFWWRAFVITRTALDGGGSRLLTFHRTVASARAYAVAIAQIAADFFQQPLLTGTITGEDPLATRTSRLNALAAAAAGVITSAKALSVGIDVPALDGVVFVEPRRSVPDVAQIVGRAVRRDPARPTKEAQILVPVVARPAPVAPAGSVTAGGRAIEGAPSDTASPDQGAAEGASLIPDRDWQALNEVIEALAEHDSRLRGALRAARAAGDPDRTGSRGAGGDDEPLWDTDAVRLDFAHWGPEARAAMAAKLTYQLAVRHARRRADYWAAVEDYLRVHGTVAMPTSTTWHGLPIGGFLSRLRREAREGKLQPSDAVRLGHCAGWSLDPARDAWIVDATRVRDWMAANGGRHPSYPCDDAQEAIVGIWVKNVRAERKPTTKRGRLAPWQEAWLEQEIPTWAWEERLAPVRRVGSESTASAPLQSRVARGGASAAGRPAAPRSGRAMAVPPPAPPVIPAEWIAHLDALAQHLATTHGQLPRMSGTPVPSVPERLLHIWLSDQEEAVSRGSLADAQHQRLVTVLRAAHPPHEMTQTAPSSSHETAPLAAPASSVPQSTAVRNAPSARP